MQASVLEPELIASGKVDGIVLGAVGGMRMSRTPEHHGTVEHVAVGLGRILEALQEVGVLLGPPTIPLTGKVGGTLVGDVVGGSLVTENVVGVVPQLAVGRILAFQHERCEAGGISLETQINKVVHTADVFLRILVRGIEVESLEVHFGQRFVRPLAGAFDALLHGPNGIQILLHFLLVLTTEAIIQASALIHQ